MNRTFINLYLDGKIPKYLLLKHLLFFTIWALFFLLVVFRIDTYFIGTNYGWLVKAIPELYFIAVIIVMIQLKWYYNLALLVYPVLQVFWFIPKFILQMGKIYLLWSYLNFIFNCFKKFKLTVIYSSVFVISLSFLFFAENNVARIIAMLAMLFFYLKLCVRHIKEALKPSALFGEKLDVFFNKLNKNRTPEKSFFIDVAEKYKDNEKLTPEQNRNKRLEQLVMSYTIMEHFKINFCGLKGTQAFYRYWLYRFFSFFILTIILFTFLNYELYSINPDNFTIVTPPSLFNFICYTIKSLALSGSDYFKPISRIAHITEISTFLIFAIFIMCLLVSFSQSLMREKVRHNVDTAISIIVIENDRIEKHIKTKYNTSVNELTQSVESIRKAVEDIKRFIGSLF
jgi:hypothetical protein